MNVEQVARNFVLQMRDTKALMGMVTPDAMASGGVLPQPIPVTESIKVTEGLFSGFPDMKIDLLSVMVNGNQATVKVKMAGTQSGSLILPGFPPIPASGKKVSVLDGYIVTVQGDKISHFEVDSPAGGGIPGMMAQLGVQMPGM
jgi:hypothetical protein